jgi:hypothetical protein
MLGTIKSLLEIALKTGSAKAILTKATADIDISLPGRDLFLIYIRGLEAVQNGSKVLDLTVSYFSALESDGDSPTTARAKEKLQKATEGQSPRVHNLAKLVRRMKAPPYVLDNKSAAYLSALFHKKLSFLRDLNRWLSDGTFLVYDDMETLLKARSEKTRLPGEEKSEDEIPHLIKLRKWLGAYRYVPGKTITELHKERREDNIELINHSRIMLKEMEVLLTNLRETLLENFSIEDVLLQISDERIG